MTLCFIASGGLNMTLPYPHEAAVMADHNSFISNP
jgi:hypothetical protein